MRDKRPIKISVYILLSWASSIMMTLYFESRKSWEERLISPHEASTQGHFWVKTTYGYTNTDRPPALHPYGCSLSHIFEHSLLCLPYMKQPSSRGSPPCSHFTQQHNLTFRDLGRNIKGWDETHLRCRKGFCFERLATNPHKANWLSS